MAKPKPWLVGLLGCCGAFALAIVSCAGLLYLGYRDAASHASPMIDELFDAIRDDAFAATYETHTTAELRAAATKQQYVALGQTINESLGALLSKSLRSFKTNRTTNGSFLEATYAARFERGAGEIHVRLRDTADGWKFVEFRVNSPRLRPLDEGQVCPACGESSGLEARFCPECGAKLPRADADDGDDSRTASDPWNSKPPGHLIAFDHVS